MKAILVFAVTIILMIACKKEKHSSPELYPGKVFRDGFLEDEYLYSTDKKLLRRNLYSKIQGQVQLAFYHLFEYQQDGTIKQVLNFNAQNTLSTKDIFSFDALKRIFTGG